MFRIEPTTCEGAPGLAALAGQARANPASIHPAHQWPRSRYAMVQ